MRKFLSCASILICLLMVSNCGNPKPNTPKSALNTISYLWTGIGMDYDKAKLDPQFTYLALLIKDQSFFATIYELKQNDYEMTRFYTKSISNNGDNQAEAVVQIRCDQKNTAQGFSQKKIFTDTYHFTMEKFKEDNGNTYWAITKADKGVM